LILGMDQVLTFPVRPRSDSISYNRPQKMKMARKDSSHPLGMTMPVISNESTPFFKAESGKDFSLWSK
jgi:hypothetical protein